MTLYRTLYKRDTEGRIRTWAMELEGNRYRTLSGIEGMKQATSEWTLINEAKSQGTPEAQAKFEVEARYTHQLDRLYHENRDDVDKPKIIAPMLAKTYGRFPGAGYAQPKLDGIRCVMTAHGMFSRQGRPITAVPHLHAAAAELFEAYPTMILDGELYNHDLRDDFGQISSIVRKKNPTAEQLEAAEKIMEYHVYDAVDPTVSFFTRIRQVSAAIDAVPWFKLVPTMPVSTEQEFDDLYAEWIGAGYEGGMYRADAPYEIGKRSMNLLKRKDFITEEFAVEAVVEGQGNWAGAAKRFVLNNNNGNGDTFGAGVRGSYAEMQAVFERVTAGELPHSVTLRFFERTPDGVPRFPVVIDIHWDERAD